MMTKQERQKAIRIKLAKNKKVYVSELAKEFSVTDRTIRSDLKELNSRRYCVLFHGGAKLIELPRQTLFQESAIKSISNRLNAITANQEKIGNNKILANPNVGVYVLGSFNVDIVSDAIKLPQAGQTIRSNSTHFYAGGKGANQATAAAKICNNVHLTVKIGQDEFAEKAKKYLSSTNIQSFTILEDESQHTGSAIVLVSKMTGNHMITIDLGANENISNAEIDNDLDLILDANVFLTQLENNFSATRYAIEKASSCNTLVMLDPAPYVKEVKDVLPLVDIVTPNEIEAEELSGVAITDLETAKEAAKRIHSFGVKNVIITMAERGCLLFDGQEYTHINAYKAAVVDTSGAGDSFTGSLAAYIAQGKSLKEAINYALAFTSLKVERKGASNMPEESLVLHRVENRKSEFKFC